MAIPGCDRDLDASDVVAIVGEQFPDIDASSAELYGVGWDNEIYRTVDGWLFRFPKRAEVVPWLLRAVEFQPMIARALAPVKVSSYELIGKPHERFPYPFAGYREVPGVPADAGPGPTAELAAVFGGALSRLHSVDPAEISSTVELWEREPWNLVWQEVWENAEGIRRLLPDDLRDAAEPYLAELPPPPLTGPKRVLHNDIAPDHVLVDPATGALAGIIDFDDLMFGDPLTDVVGLVGWAGFGFCEQILDHYELELDAHARERLRWTARVTSLHWLHESDGTEDIAKHQRWVRRCFEDR